MTTQDLMAKLQTLSQIDRCDAGLALHKLTEEVGELSAAYLAHINSPNRSASAEDNLLEEGVDVLMCAIDVLLKSGYDLHQLEEMMQKKLEKWSNKIARRTAEAHELF